MVFNIKANYEPSEILILASEAPTNYIERTFMEEASWLLSHVRNKYTQKNN